MTFWKVVLIAAVVVVVIDAVKRIAPQTANFL